MKKLNLVAAAALCGSCLGIQSNANAGEPSERITAETFVQPPVTALLNYAVRSIDGSGNNVANPNWGAAHEQLLRKTPIAYGDMISTPAGASLPSARAVSNAVCNQLTPVPNLVNASDMIWQWGQFIDHDIDLTEAQVPEEFFNISVPLGDTFFDPGNTGTEEITLARSDYDILTGLGPGNPRQQVNGISAYLDGSVIYGSGAVRANALRAFDGTGRLKTSAGDLLPFNVDGLPNAGGSSPTLFLAGDVRANEQIGLTAMHTLWVREHNRVAMQLGASNPFLTEESLYQLARIYVVAELQIITYEEWLPVLLGPDAIPPYVTYDPAIDAGIANVFSTACYRLGHSMLPNELRRLDADGSAIAAGHLELRDAFFNPERLTDAAQGGLEPLLRGLTDQSAQNVDMLVQDSIRNFLFGEPGAGGFDLASLNIQRGRDHGLPPYNDVREAYGLDRAESFADVSANPDVPAALASVYADVDDIDAWVGSICEDHLPGAMGGELVQAVLVDQFTRMRDGDSFWYQRIFSTRALPKLSSIRLSDVIRANTDISEEIPDDVFHVPALLASCPADVWPAPADEIAGDGTVDIYDLIAVVNAMGSDTPAFDVAPARKDDASGDG
ncbi:MAG: peroxidase family protein, partial [Planctomycetota bacterium]